MKPAAATAIRRPRRARGVAAVEMACILLVLFLLVPSVFFFGRGVYHYGVVKQATRDAANYVASSPIIAITADGQREATVSRAEDMVRNALAEANIVPDSAVTVIVLCHENYGCTQARPTMVSVSASYGMHVTLLDGFLSRWFDIDSVWMVEATTAVSYAN